LPPCAEIHAQEVVETSSTVSHAELIHFTNEMRSAVSSLERIQVMVDTNTGLIKQANEYSRRLEAVFGLTTSVLLAALALLVLDSVAVGVSIVVVVLLTGVGLRFTYPSEVKVVGLADEVVGLKHRLEEGIRVARQGAESENSPTSSSPRGFNLDATIDETGSDETARLAGMTLNCFSSVPNLDFDRDVFSKLDDAHKAAFLLFSEKFKVHLSTLGRLLDSQIPDNYTGLRFLQADQYRVDDAVVRLSKTIVWRMSNLDEFILHPNWTLINRCRGLRPRVWCGYDAKGRPLMFEKLGLFFGSEEAYKGL